jgi:hypothetical protein
MNDKCKRLIVNKAFNSYKQVDNQWITICISYLTAIFALAFDNINAKAEIAVYLKSCLSTMLLQSQTEFREATKRRVCQK